MFPTVITFVRPILRAVVKVVDLWGDCFHGLLKCDPQCSFYVSLLLLVCLQYALNDDGFIAICMLWALISRHSISVFLHAFSLHKIYIMNGIAIEISKVPVDCTLTPPSLLIKFSSKARVTFHCNWPLYLNWQKFYVGLNILEYCSYCKFFYMSYIPVPCLNLSSLDSHKIDSTGK